LKSGIVSYEVSSSLGISYFYSPLQFVPFSVRSSLADIYESSFIGIGPSSSMILAENLRNEGTIEDLRDLNNKAEL